VPGSGNLYGETEILKALVIGATGFIGGAIVRAGVARGWEVRALRRDERRVGAVGDLAGEGRIEWRQANLSDATAVVAAMFGCDVVFHAAGYYPTSSREPARQMHRAEAEMEGVLSAFRQAKPDLLVYTSSLSTIGPSSEPGRLANESDYYQLGDVSAPYFDIKMLMEQKALDTRLPVVVLCPTLVLGPGDVKPTSGRLLLAVARGRVPVYTSGQINIVDVRDVAEASMAVAEQGRPGERYIVGAENMSFHHMLTVMAREAGRRPPWLHLPSGLVERLGELAGKLGIAEGDMLRAIRYFQPLDANKARVQLGLRPRPFAETVRDALTWFHDHGYFASAPSK
jgi:dihydroflavonol-4-reductase